MVLFQDSDLEASGSQVNTAPNIIADGHCKACNTSVNLDAHTVQCWLCKNMFHAINCENDKNCVSAPTVFNNQLLPALNKSGAYEKRFGHFLFVCDFCMTKSEKDQTMTKNDQVNVLDKKIDQLQSDFRCELLEIKNVLKEVVTNSHVRTSEQDTSATTNICIDSPWDDAQKVDHIKTMMVIKKDKDGKSVDMKLLEKTCVENGVGVLNSFKLNKSEDTAVVCKSKKDAEILKQKLTATLPDHKLDHMSARLPRITIVGLEREYEKNELKEMICKQNPGISTLLNDPDSSEEDKKLDVVAVLPLKKNNSIFKAIILVSNLIRSVISKQNDRIFVGSQRVCKVYDNFFVLRCYNCQDFGHHSKDCSSSVICGHCSGSHQTRSCDKKADPIVACCNNCKVNGLTEVNHPTNDLACPQFIKQQEKVKKSTPFHQSKN